ncbi:MAG: hypothetical protein GX893_06930 [Firmicutes bacterium]|nr:hypothetical protein [Bacillota bacterium]
MKKIFQVLVFISMLIFLPGKAYAAGKVVIFSLNCVSLEQLLENKEINYWLTQGSVGLLNTGTAASAGSRHLAVTLGAGSRALGTDHTRLALQQEEKYEGIAADIIFHRHQGIMPQGRIVHLGMAELIAANKELPHPVQPGLLGDTLHVFGKKTAVLGNADTLQHQREMAAVLADSTGQIDFGQVSEAILVEDDSFPYGRRINKEMLWQAYSDLYPFSDVLLIDWGDTARLDAYRLKLREDVASKIEAKIFADINWFLQRLIPALGPEDVLLIMAAVPPSQKSGAETLGFIAVFGKTFPANHLLTSATTQRAGLASVTDIAPFILSHLGLPQPQDMLGCPLTLAEKGDIDDLLTMRNTIDRIYRLRPPLLKTYVVLQIIFVLGALLNLFVQILAAHFFEAVLLGLMTVPLLLLYLPLGKISLVAGFFVTVVAVLITVIVLLRFVPNVVVRFAIIGIATSISLLVDIICNAQLMKVSVLGYDPVAGARYYGMGNEYMGVWVGATILAAAAVSELFPHFRRKILIPIIIFFLMIIFLLILPTTGANFGGTLTAISAFTISVLLWANFRPSWKNIGFILLFLAAVGILAVFINLAVPQRLQSHLGRTLVLLQHNGWQILKDIIIRKAKMNIKLFRYSQWSRALLAFLLMLAVLFYRPRGILKDISKKYPMLSVGFWGVIAGSITAFLVNDSGVVAAATTLLYAGVPIIILAGRVNSEIGTEKSLYK